jgi:hypothetical protein
MSESQGWPVAELDAVRRLRMLASASGGLYAEGLIAAPFERIWAAASDQRSDGRDNEVGADQPKAPN